jgi:hypothetical protein
MENLLVTFSYYLLRNDETSSSDRFGIEYAKLFEDEVTFFTKKEIIMQIFKRHSTDIDFNSVNALRRFLEGSTEPAQA